MQTSFERTPATEIKTPLTLELVLAAQVDYQRGILADAHNILLVPLCVSQPPHVLTVFTKTLTYSEYLAIKLSHGALSDYYPSPDAPVQNPTIPALPEDIAGIKDKALQTRAIYLRLGANDEKMNVEVTTRAVQAREQIDRAVVFLRAAALCNNMEGVIAQARIIYGILGATTESGDTFALLLRGA